MSSYIAENLDAISQQHYVRRAGAIDYWFDFSYGKLEEYRAKFRDNFCLVLYASDNEDDTYVMPYAHLKHMLQDQFLDERRRWMGSISENLLRIRKSNQSMSVSAYYKAFEYLSEESDDALSILKEPNALYDVGEVISLADLASHIYAINERYRDALPHKQKRVSEYVARPNAITDYLKRYRKFTCQICGQTGFIQQNGLPYMEAHHIIELHKLAPGSLCSDNIIVLCATCHRKLHYARVAYKFGDVSGISVEINDEHFTFERNIISEARSRRHSSK